jgi:Uma2 family endonuclease
MEAVIKEMPKHWLEERRNSDASRWDEMWDGVLHMAPMPNTVHQYFVRDLMTFLQLRWGKPNGGQVVHEVNLTTLEDAANWTNNFRAPDLVLLSADRLKYDHIEYIAGPPLVCVEVRSPKDESYEKLPFYAGLGVPEVWIIDRDTKKPDLLVLKDGEYQSQSADQEGWLLSDAVGVRMKDRDAKLLMEFDGDAEPSVIPE